MSHLCILIANASRARLYETHRGRLINQNGKSDTLTLIKEYSHEASRKRDVDLVTDRLGNYNNFQGNQRGTSTFAEPTDPKEVEAERFALELARELESRRTNSDWGDLIIAATPHFQGLIQKHLSEPLTHLLSQKIEKDYTQFNGRELAKHLAEQL